MKHKTQFRLSIILILFFAFSFAHAATFPRNLKQGTSGDDVLALQKLLNSIPGAEIVSSGSGSPGQETVYFGRLTTQAVIKFQKLYGISPSYGFVGPVTREKLNSLSELKVVIVPNPPVLPTPTPKTTSSTSPSHDLMEFYSHFINPADKSPIIFGLSASQVALGNTLTLYGVNLSSQNTHIYIGQNEIKPSFSLSSGTSSTIVVPSSLSTGTYDIWASNSVGNNKNKVKQHIEVTNSPLPKPIIYWSTPLAVTMEDTITIHGANFSSFGNSINTGFGSIKDLSSSDGQTLSFRVKDLSSIGKANQDPKLKGIKVPMSFAVKSKGGGSNQTGLFYIKF